MHTSSDSAKDARQHYTDSLKEARVRISDSMKTERQHALDSVKSVRTHSTDSIKNIRKHYADSLSRVHSYKDSKHYRDSVTKARTTKIAIAQKQRKTVVDSMKSARKKTLDSAVAIRKARIDNIHKIQKHRTDSMALIRRYKQSKRYTDSVSIVRHARMDSMHVMRKKFNDSLGVVRKFQKDSVTKVRKHTMDSIKVVRTKYTDSIKAIRKARTDSLAKIKADKEKLLKAQQANKEKKSMMALDLKIKQKREKWSNENMLKKKWRAPRTYMQNTVTRYNYFFNANRKMDEALANMQRGRKDNFDSLLGMYPFDPNRDSSMLSADMDSIIHKVSVGIQIHDPRTKWADDLYLLLGEAYYYKGGYENAATSFRYIISMDEQKKKDEAAMGKSKSKEGPSIIENEKHSRLDFLKHQPVHNEAILWLSRTYTESHQIENAESILSLLDSDPNLPDNLKGRLALEKAFVHLSDHNYEDASKELEAAAADNNIPEWIRERCAFINGQLLQKDGKYVASNESFKKVLGFNPKIEMEFYARKYMTYNTMYAGGDVAGMIASLEKVLNDGKYIPYYDQVYFLLGQLAANGHNTEDAIAYLQKSINTPKATKKQKSISFATLGNVYFSDGEYLDAKKAYDSSVKYASTASKDSVVKLAAKRSKVLGEVATPLNIIHDEDSLLALASLSDKEQNAAVRKYLRYLERKRADSIYKAENAGVNSVPVNESAEASSWYFSNQGQMQQGFNAFKQKWGNRPLTDNWRRIAGMSNNTAASAADSSASPEQKLTLDENGLPTQESLLSMIPNTPESKEKAEKKIQKAFIDLSDAYIQQLEDYPLAIRTLDTLDKRYPDHIYKETDAYMRYLVALRQGKVDQAIVYSTQILQQFPNSKYAALVRPTEDRAGRIDTGVTVANFYDETYGLLLQYQYTDVLARSRQGQKKYKDTTYNTRFRIMEAISLAGSGNYKQADTLLKEFLKVHPSDSLKFWADDLVKFISKNPPMPLAGNNNGPLKSHWPYYGDPIGKPSGFIDELNPHDAADLANAKTKRADTVFATTQEENKPIKAYKPLPALIEYEYKPEVQQYVGILLPGMEYRLAKLRSAIKDIDAAKFPTASVYIDLFKPEQTIILVKGFANVNEAKIYLRALGEASDIFKEYNPNEFQLFIISDDGYKKLQFDRDINAYLDFYNRNFK